MNWLVYHVVSGQAFFTGVVLLIGAAFASTRATPVFRRVTALSFLIGIIAVVVSSTPIPYWYYAVTAAITAVWMISKWRTQWRQWTPYAVIGVWLVAGLIELPYHFTHSLLPVSERKITVIGDSVTAVAAILSRIWPYPADDCREIQRHFDSEESLSVGHCRQRFDT